MKKINLFLFLWCLCPFIVKAQQNYEDVVSLKTGSVIRGVIIEEVPNVSIKIKTKDGSVFVYNFSEVQRMEKEQVKNSFDTRQNNNLDRTYKNPTTALLWSFLIPGGGQFYNHQNTKGAIMLGIDLVAVGVSIVGATHKSYHNGYYHSGVHHSGYYIGNYWVSGYTSPGYSDPGYFYSDPSILMYIGFGVGLVNGIYSMIDASSSAKSINRKNGLGFNLKLNNNTDLALMPDYKFNYYGVNKLSPVFGAKLSLSFH